MKRTPLILGPAVGILIPLVLDIPAHPQAPFMLGIVLWMALWWISECVPLPVTAMIPLLAFPLTGIAPAGEVAPRYMTSIMFLFIGGFLIAQAMERTGLHRRLALGILARWHASPVQILAGFAGTTAFLSMWISNTATTMLMMTIAMPVLSHLDKSLSREHAAAFAVTLLLLVAYSANIGGMGTPVGTVPNLVFLEVIAGQGDGMQPSFLQWMMVGVPVVITGIILLITLFARRVRHMTVDPEALGITEAQQALGPVRREERLVAWVLGLTALAWLTRKGIQTEDFHLPGWSSLLPYPGVDDGTVAITAALLLFLLPAHDGRPVLDGQAIGRLPWGILILLGGGFALAMGMQHSGLSLWLGEQLQFFTSVPGIIMLIAVAVGMTFVTEITSNTAITQVMLPVLAAVAGATTHDITLLLITATLCASCAFMLPTATPPNAIVFGSERIPMEQMVHAGFRLNLTMPLVIVVLASLLRPMLP